MQLKLTREKLIKETIRMKIYDVTYSNLDKEVLTHTIVRSKPSVLVIPKKDNKLVFIKEFRSTTGNYYLEFPAGLIEEGEDVFEASYRETEEETGLKVEDLSILATKTLMDISVSDENLTILIGRVSGISTRHLDFMEIISEDLIYLDEDIVYERLNKELYEGIPFYDNTYLSGATRYALLAYFNKNK